MFRYSILLKINNEEYQYLFKLFHILTKNEINYVLDDDIN
jgi:hypothetical protein